MAGKESIVIILDIHKSMSKPFSSNPNKTRFDIAIDSIKCIINQKLLFNLKDEVCLILVGTKESDNILNDKKNGYNNISNARDFNACDQNFLKMMDDLLISEDYYGDVFEAVNLSCEMFLNRYGKLKYTKRMFLFTDGETPIDDKLTKLIAQKINNNDLRLNIITIDFMKDIDEGMELENNISINNKIMETNIQNRNRIIIDSLLKESIENIRIFSAHVALKIYKQFKKKRVNYVAKYRGQFEISPNLLIEICVYGKTLEVKLPSLKKFSLATNFSENINQGKIDNERIYFIKDDPDKNPIPENLKIKGYNYGKSIVPIGKTEEEMFKFNQDEIGLQAIGFTDSSKIPRHHFMSGVDLVIPNPKSDSDKTAFEAIVQAMISLNKVLISRFCPRKNSQPKLSILSPYIGRNGAVFYLNELPTNEDIRDFQFESLNECNKKQEEVVSKFIDSLDLNKVYIDSQNNNIESLKPTSTFNPVLQHFYQSLENRAMNENKISPLVNLDENIISYMKPDRNLFEGNKYVGLLKKVFDIKEKDKQKDNKKRVFWRDIIKSEISENTGVSDKKLEEKLDKQKENYKKEISAINPIEDFKELIDNKYEDLTISAIKQLQDIIFKFIKESFKGSYFIKALECIKTLREACIIDEEPNMFNKFLEEIKINFSNDKYFDFCKLIYDNHITLIIKNESNESEITKEQSENFINSLIKKSQLESSTLKEIDDLIGDID